MRNSTKILIGVVVVALVGAGVYFGNTGLQKGSLGALSSPSPAFRFVWVTLVDSTLLTGNQVEVARFHIDAKPSSDPKAYVTVPQLNFYNLSTATLTNFTLRDITQNVNVATNSNSGNFHNAPNGGNMKPLVFQQGESRTFKILADVGTNAGNQTAQLKYKDSLSSKLTAASVGVDTTPPSIASFVSDSAQNTFTVFFSEKINPIGLNLVYGGTVTDLNNATFGGKITYSLNNDGTVLTLKDWKQFPLPNPSIKEMLTAVFKGIKDTAGNTLK